MLPLLFAFLLINKPAELLERGLLALQKGQLVEARTALEECSRLDPNNAYAWSSLAETYRRLNNSSKAAAAAKTAEKTGAGNPLVSHALAMFYTHTGEFTHAAQLEQQFAESPKADPSAMERAAALYLDGGDAINATNLAQKAVETHPSPSAEDLLGRALIAAGRISEGETQINAAWNANKTDPHIAFDLAQSLLHKEDFTQAAGVLDSALSAHPDDPQLRLAMGVARYGQRRFEDAIMAFLQVVKIDPQIDQPYQFLGKLLDQVGDHLPEITRDFQTWAAKNPKNAQAQLLLAKAKLAADSKDTAAETLLRQSILLDPADWESHYELGVLLETRRDWKSAAADVTRSAELNPKQPMPHYHLARVYDRLGEPERAKTERELHERLSGAEAK